MTEEDKRIAKRLVYNYPHVGGHVDLIYWMAKVILFMLELKIKE